MGGVAGGLGSVRVTIGHLEASVIAGNSGYGNSGVRWLVNVENVAGCCISSIAGGMWDVCVIWNLGEKV